MEETKRSKRVSDLLQYFQEMEGKKAEASYQKQCGNQEPQKEEDLLLPCPGLPDRGNKEGLRGMEQCKEDQH